MTKTIAPETVAEPRPEAKETKSKGEKLFNRVVYGGLAGVVTFVVTLIAAFEIKYGRWKPNYLSAVEKTDKAVQSLASIRSGRKFAEGAVETTALMQGGNLMVIPVLAAEHYKVPIVNGLNVMLGDTTPPEEVKQAPKQTMMSLIEGRLLAWGAVFSTLFTASMVFSKTFATFTNEFAERTCQLFNKSTHVLQDGKYLLDEAGRKIESKTFRYGRIAALDVFATAAAATLLYVGGHFFARKQEQRHLRKELRTEAGVRLDADGQPVMAGPELNVAEKPSVAVSADRSHDGTVHAVKRELSNA